MECSITANISVSALQKFAPMKINELQEELFIQYQDGYISDNDLVQIFEQIAVFLNLRTITNYAKANRITYNGALKRKLNKVAIDNQTFIIDNE